MMDVRPSERVARASARDSQSTLLRHLLQHQRQAMSTPGSSDTRTRRSRASSTVNCPTLAARRLDKSSPRPTLMQEIETLLAELAETNDAMSARRPTRRAARRRMHKLQRHREILHDLQQEFSKSKANLHAANERSQLLSSVREDIREHRCARAARPRCCASATPSTPIAARPTRS